MVLVLMGVTGSGKTTVGMMLADKLGWQFADADDFHPAANIEKMRSGVPLDDSDRGPWLKALHEAIQQWNKGDKNVVLACSALKRNYRDQLRAGPVRFVFLKGARELIGERLRARHGHFASDAILNGQFLDLEEPEITEGVITIEVTNTPEAIVSEIIDKMSLFGVRGAKGSQSGRTPAR